MLISDANYKMQLGDSAIDFNLEATDGNTYTLKSFRAPLLVIFFTCNHCPYAQAYEHRVSELVIRFKGKADFVAINSNDESNYEEDSFANMKLRAEHRGFNYPYLHDETQQVAEAYGAECTPQFFAFDEHRKLRYQGHLDDNWRETMAKKHDLKEALQALAEGKHVPIPITNAQGCSIKWKQEKYGIDI